MDWYDSPALAVASRGRSRFRKKLLLRSRSTAPVRDRSSQPPLLQEACSQTDLLSSELVSHTEAQEFTLAQLRELQAHMMTEFQSKLSEKHSEVLAIKAKVDAFEPSRRKART